MKAKEGRGLIYAISGAFSNASMVLFAKLAVDVNTETIVFFRNFICFLSVLFLVFGKKDFLKTNRYKLHLFRAICGLSAVYCYYYAVKVLPLVNAIVLANTSSLFIPIVVFIWLSVKIPLRRCFAVILGFIGVIFILKPEVGGFNDTAGFLGLFAGLCIAVAMVGVRQLTKTERTEVIIFYFFLIATFVSFFPMILSWSPISPKMWIYVIGTGLFGTLFQVFLTNAYKYMPATKASSLMYISVIFGGIFEYFVYGSIPDFWQLLGIGLIILGGILALLDPKNSIRMSKKPKRF